MTQKRLSVTKSFPGFTAGRYRKSDNRGKRTGPFIHRRTNSLDMSRIPKCSSPLEPLAGDLELTLSNQITIGDSGPLFMLPAEIPKPLDASSSYGEALPGDMELSYREHVVLLPANYSSPGDPDFITNTASKLNLNIYQILIPLLTYNSWSTQLFAIYGIQ